MYLYQLNLRVHKIQEINYLLLGELLILVLLVRFVRQGLVIHRPRHLYHSGNLDGRFPMSHVGFEKL